MKHKLPIIVGVAALAIALMVWRWRGDESTLEATSRDTSGKTAARAATKRVDPRTLARGLISGNVRDENKLPISGASVCAHFADDDLESAFGRDSFCAITDAQGAYRLTEMVATSYRIVAGARTFRPSTFKAAGERVPDVLVLSPGAHRSGVDFVLAAGGVEITGTVSDVSGGPIAHARIRTGSPRVETDERGAFSLWTTPGAAAVSADADGYVSTQANCNAPCRLELLLTPEASIAGTVVDGQTGGVIEGARIRVTNADWENYSGTRKGRTDATGSFRVGRLTPARYDVIVIAEHAYGRSEGSILVGLGESVGGVVIKLFPAARITGKVIIASSPPQVCINGRVSLRPAVRTSYTPTRSEDDGTIVADGVLPEMYEVTPSCKGYVARESYPPIVVAAADISGLTWEVDPGATLRGRVLNQRGQPVAKAAVRSRTEGAGPRPRGHAEDVVSSIDGRYELTGLLAGRYSIQISSGDGAEGSFDVDVAAGTTVEKDWGLDDVTALSGTIVDAAGQPVPGAHVVANRDGATAVSSIESDADGRFRIALRAGEYKLRAYSVNVTLDTGDVDGVPVTVHAGKTSSIKLVAKLDSGAIRGTVVDGKGAGVPDAYVLAHIEEGDAQLWMMRSGRSSVRPILASTDGSFTLTGLRPGSYSVRAYRPGGGEAIAEKVPVGATTRLEIKTTGSVEGVALIRGEPTPIELKVAADDPHTGMMRSETLFRTDGRYAVHDLPPGRYRITVDGLTARGAVEVEVLANEHKRGVVIELTPLITLTGRVVDIATGAPIAGVRMAATLIEGSYLDYVGGSSRGGHVSDKKGRFSIARVSPGRLHISGDGNDLGPLELERTISGAGTVALGDLAVARARLKEGDEPGELGVETVHGKDGRMIRTIVPRSGAEKAGLQVGDVITAIDGTDVTGERGVHVTTLLTAPVGQKVLLGLARGVTVPVILGPRTSP